MSATKCRGLHRAEIDRTAIPGPVGAEQSVSNKDKSRKTLTPICAPSGPAFSKFARPRLTRLPMIELACLVRRGLKFPFWTFWQPTKKLTEQESLSRSSISLVLQNMLVVGAAGIDDELDFTLQHLAHQSMELQLHASE